MNGKKNTHKNSFPNTWLIPAGGITFLLVFISLLLFFTIAWAVFIENNSSGIDDAVFNSLVLHRTDNRTSIMHSISFLGSHTFLVPVNLLLITYFIFIRKKNIAVLTFAVAISNLLLMSLLKRLFRRIRPEQAMVEGITNFSFPSGHAFMSVAFYGLLIWLAAISITNILIRRIIIGILLLMIIAIGFSRIYLRMHYTTDVVAGFCMGFIWLIVCLFLTNNRKNIIAT
jgi:membrane-associated phospholipid phosphatase